MAAMPELPRRHLVFYALGLVAILAVGARHLAARDAGVGAPEPSRAPAVQVSRPPPARLIVHVAGAVRRPGVYHLREGKRVDDAIARAGGPARRADIGALNLAAKLEDGRQVLVPRKAATGEVTAAPDAAATAGVAGAAGAASAGAPAAPPINLNTATIEQLDQLDGIGPGIARKILQYRVERGGFSTVEELKQVPGIGEARFASLKERVTA